MIRRKAYRRGGVRRACDLRQEDPGGDASRSAGKRSPGPGADSTALFKRVIGHGEIRAPRCDDTATASSGSRTMSRISAHRSSALGWLASATGSSWRNGSRSSRASARPHRRNPHCHRNPGGPDAGPTRAGRAKSGYPALDAETPRRSLRSPRRLAWGIETMAAAEGGVSAGAPAEAVPVLVIEPGRRLAAVRLNELWQYRELLYFLVWRDIKVRYKQTVLGAAWAILQPLATAVVFTLFFGRLAGIGSDGLPYPLFSYAGLLVWTFFAQGLAQSSASVVD